MREIGARDYHPTGKLVLKTCLGLVCSSFKDIETLRGFEAIVTLPMCLPGMPLPDPSPPEDTTHADEVQCTGRIAGLGAVESSFLFSRAKVFLHERIARGHKGQQRCCSLLPQKSVCFPSKALVLQALSVPSRQCSGSDVTGRFKVLARVVIYFSACHNNHNRTSSYPSFKAFGIASMQRCVLFLRPGAMFVPYYQQPATTYTMCAVPGTVPTFGGAVVRTRATGKVTARALLAVQNHSALSSGLKAGLSSQPCILDPHSNCFPKEWRLTARFMKFDMDQAHMGVAPMAWSQFLSFPCPRRGIRISCRLLPTL